VPGCLTTFVVQQFPAWDWPLTASRLTTFLPTPAVLCCLCSARYRCAYSLPPGCISQSGVGLHCSMQAVYQKKHGRISQNNRVRTILLICICNLSYACISGILFSSSSGLSVFGPMSCPRTSYHPCMHRIASCPWRMTDRCSHQGADLRSDPERQRGSIIKLSTQEFMPARPPSIQQYASVMACHVLYISRLRVVNHGLDALSCIHETSLHARVNIMCSERRRHRRVSLATRGTGHGCMAFPLTGSLHPTRPRVKVRPCRLVRSSGLRQQPVYCSLA